MHQKISILVTLLLFIISISNVQAYTLHYRIQDDGTANHYAKPPSVYWTENCHVNFYLYGTANSTAPYSLENHWYSPNDIEINSGLAPFTTPISCLNLGNATTTSPSASDFYEVKTKTISSATVSTKTWNYVNYTCDIDENDLFIYKNTLKKDSFGNYPYAYYERVWTCCQTGACSTPNADTQSTTMINYLKNGHYNTCSSSTLKVDTTTSFGCGGNRYMGLSHWIAVPFNSMESGIVNISVEDINHYASATINTIIQTHLYYVYLWDTVTDSKTSLSTNPPYSASIPVVENRDYWLLIGKLSYGWSGDFGGSFTYNYTDYNITINAYEPAWVCTDWSECEQNLQYRDCTDPLGKLPPRKFYRTCGIPLPERREFLGFEDTISVPPSGGVWRCDATNYFECLTGLGAYLRTDRLYPKDWTVFSTTAYDATSNQTGKLEDYITMCEGNTETCKNAEGSTKSLKMWYVPPKPYLPQYNSTLNTVTCSNITQGYGAVIGREINQTFWIARNVTALTPFMSLYFEAATCEDLDIPNEIEYYGLFGCYLKPFDQCYTFNGSCYEGIKPIGRLGIRFREIGGTLDKSGLLNIDAKYFHLGANELNLDGLDINATYEISFVIPPNDFTDRNSYCVFLDNVYIYFREEELVCESICIDDFNEDGIPDYTWLRRTSLGTDLCREQAFNMHENCVPAEIRPIIEDCDEYQDKEHCPDFCIDLDGDGIKDDLQTWDEDFGRYITIESSDYCIAQEEEIAESQKPLYPISGEEIVEGTENLLATPAFFSLLISGLIGALITRFVSRYTQKGEWIIGALMFLGILGVFSFTPMPSGGTYFPTWYYIALIVISGIIMGSMFREKIFG